MTTICCINNNQLLRVEHVEGATFDRIFTLLDRDGEPYIFPVGSVGTFILRSRLGTLLGAFTVDILPTPGQVRFRLPAAQTVGKVGRLIWYGSITTDGITVVALEANEFHVFDGVAGESSVSPPLPPLPNNPLYESAEIDVNCFAGQVLYVKNNGHLGLAQANALGTTTIAGLAVSGSIATTMVTYDPDGVLELSDWTQAIGTPLLMPGRDYYLSPNVHGQMTTIVPETVGQFVVVMGSALSPTRFSIEVTPRIAL